MVKGSVKEGKVQLDGCVDAIEFRQVHVADSEEHSVVRTKGLVERELSLREATGEEHAYSIGQMAST